MAIDCAVVKRVTVVVSVASGSVISLMVPSFGRSAWDNQTSEVASLLVAGTGRDRLGVGGAARM